MINPCTINISSFQNKELRTVKSKNTHIELAAFCNFLKFKKPSKLNSARVAILKFRHVQSYRLRALNYRIIVEKNSLLFGLYAIKKTRFISIFKRTTRSFFKHHVQSERCAPPLKKIVVLSRTRYYSCCIFFLGTKLY